LTDASPPGDAPPSSSTVLCLRADAFIIARRLMVGLRLEEDSVRATIQHERARVELVRRLSLKLKHQSSRVQLTPGG
jgi:hypothetical protein